MDVARQEVIGRLKGLGFTQEAIEWFTGSYSNFPEDRPDQIQPIDPPTTGGGRPVNNRLLDR